MGMPIAFAIGISGALFFVQHPELPYTIPIQQTVSQTQNFALLAIPLFIMAGNFMNKSGITEELLNLASVIAGRLKGGLAQVSLVLAGLMAACPPGHRRRGHAGAHAGTRDESGCRAALSPASCRPAAS
jgi:TRAP-type mannitol/chloroaromatic compound transport system permease large subunit